jgi:hypothetical protein
MEGGYSAKRQKKYVNLHIKQINHMEEINHTYTIQWVGPFSDYEDFKSYCKRGQRKGDNQEVAHSSLFSFYYFEGNKKWQRDRIFRYFGKHTNPDGIQRRLNKQHEHFKKYHENENMQIWIGTLSTPDVQKPEIIDYIETVFINRYKIDLNDNTMKKALPLTDALDKSIVIVNLWYDTDERPYRGRSIVPFEDVIVYESDIQRLLSGTLHKKNIEL